MAFRLLDLKPARGIGLPPCRSGNPSTDPPLISNRPHATPYICRKRHRHVDVYPLDLVYPRVNRRVMLDRAIFRAFTLKRLTLSVLLSHWIFSVGCFFYSAWSIPRQFDISSPQPLSRFRICYVDGTLPVTGIVTKFLIGEHGFNH